MLPALLNPMSVFKSLDAIDKEPPSFKGDRLTGSRVTLVVLFSVCVSLHLLNYLKTEVAFVALLEFAARFQGYPQNYWLQSLHDAQWYDLARLAWWSWMHVVTFILIPWFTVRVFLKVRMRDLGWGWGETHKHWFGYLYLLLPILVCVVLVSFRKDFVDYYPFYRGAGRSYFDLIAWEVLYLLQFVCVEFFFRGFMINVLRPYFGSAAIWIMVVPYMMIHLSKPWLESTGAIFFGLFLGILAFRSRSIWGGFLVHAGVATSMDIASLTQQDSLPDQWWPDFFQAL